MGEASLPPQGRGGGGTPPDPDNLLLSKPMLLTDCSKKYVLDMYGEALWKQGRGAGDRRLLENSGDPWKPGGVPTRPQNWAA